MNKVALSHKKKKRKNTNSSERGADACSAVANLHDVQLMQQLFTHQFKCIQAADEGFGSGVFARDVTQGCGDRRRQLRLPRLKSTTAGISFAL